MIDVDARFRLVWLGQIVSLVGSAVSSFGAAIWIFDETDSYLWLGGALAAVSFAQIAAVPFSSVADRFDRRNVMIVADGSAAVIAVGLLCVYLSGVLQPYHLAVGGAVIAFFSAFQATAYAAAIPDLVSDRSQLDRVNGLVQLGPAISLVLGPAGASFLLVLGGVGAILAVDLASFAVGISTVAIARFSSLPHRGAADDGSVRRAVAWLRGNGREVLAIFALAAAVNALLGILNVVVLGRATRLGGAGEAGWPVAAGGLAMVVTSILVGRTGLPTRRSRVVAAGLAWFGAMTLVAAAREFVLLFAAGVALAFAAVPPVQAALTTILHRVVPRPMRGRVFGLYSGVALGFGMIGALAGGALGNWSEAGTLFLIGAALIALSSGVLNSTSMTRLDTKSVDKSITSS